MMRAPIGNHNNNYAKPLWIFIIDTDAYAGNFERQLGTYITGEEIDHMPGGVGWILDIARKELGGKIEVVDHGGWMGKKTYWSEGPFADWLHDWHDGESYRRYAHMVRSPGGEYNSVGLFFERKPTKALIELMKQRAEAFPNVVPPPKTHEHEYISNPPKYKVTGFRLMKMTTKFTSVPIP